MHAESYTETVRARHFALAYTLPPIGMEPDRGSL